jgi:hypothetical protein
MRVAGLGRQEMHRVLMGKYFGKRQLGTSRRRCNDNVKLGLREISCEDRRRMNWLSFVFSWGEFLQNVT